MILLRLFWPSSDSSEPDNKIPIMFIKENAIELMIWESEKAFSEGGGRRMRRMREERMKEKKMYFYWI